ncbi:MAG: thermonuclease family protein [Proteobacteria bacterium]|nr:thermonuclease family protein [Pseudomonadota bacterium]
MAGWLAAGSGSAGELSGRVTWVYDGDTIKVDGGDRTWRVRVFGVDTPESGQPYSKAASRFTIDLVKNRIVTIRVVETDKYGRIVGQVILPDGRNLGRELLRAGLAWHFRWFSDDPDLARLEKEARAARRGLWADPGPVPPWEYKRSHPRRSRRPVSGGRPKRPESRGAPKGLAQGGASDRRTTPPPWRCPGDCPG